MRHNIEPIHMTRFARIRYYWPPPRPRAILRRLLRFLLALIGTSLLVILLAVLAGCGGPQSQLVVTIASTAATSGAAAIAPPSVGDPVAYRLDGAGPLGAAFSHTVDDLPADVEGLVPGEWSIAVQALDDTGEVVLEGGSIAFVASAGTTPVSVTLETPAGAGQVSLSVSWPPALVSQPDVNVVLERDSEEPVALLIAVQPEDGEAECGSSEVPAGWYRLRLQLLDGVTVVAGRADLLQVREATTTTASIHLAELNKPGAPVNVTGDTFTLYWDSADPNPADPAVSYNLYFRTHGTYPWTFLASTGGLEESFTVSSALLAHGSYDFAVSAVTASGAESEPHTSLDDTADPATGWYVVWEP